MTSPHIKIMTPCHGGWVSTSYAASLLELVVACQRRGVGLSWDVRDGGTDIARAREACVVRFLADAAATHLLFIDADIGFASEQVFRLLARNADFTAVTYPLKKLDWDRIATTVRRGLGTLTETFSYAVEWEKSGQIVARDDFVRVPYVGIGFTLIRRSALIRLVNAYAMREPGCSTDAQPQDACASGPGLFGGMIEAGTGMYLSECFALCRRWRDLGGEIWVDIRSRLTHVGPVTFRGDLFAQLQPFAGAGGTTAGSVERASPGLE